MIRVKLESPLSIDECKRRLRNNSVQPFQKGIKLKYSIAAIVIGNRGSLVIRKYIFPGFVVRNSLLPACRYKLEENSNGTTVDVIIGAQPVGLFLVLILLGAETFFIVSSIAQHAGGDFSFNGIIIYSIITVIGLTLLLGGMIKDAPNIFVSFLKITLDINDITL